jgi:hypothetical protein
MGFKDSVAKGLKAKLTSGRRPTEQVSSKKTKVRLRIVNSSSEVKKAPVVDQPPSLIEIIEGKAVRDRLPHAGFFRPSGLFGCDRSNVFHYQMVREEPNQITNQLLRILDNGTAVHNVVQDEYLANDFDFWYVKEPRVKLLIRGAWVKGSCDGVLIRRSDMFRWGVEIKTINHDEFMRLTKPKEEHVFQASIYMNLQNLPWITIIYWDKDKQHLKEYHVRRNRKMWSEVEERVEYLYSFVESDKLPAYDKATCNKTFCRYVTHCRRKGAPV